MSVLDQGAIIKNENGKENIERITSVAAAELAGDTAVVEERPDPDWVMRFFGSAEDITSQQLQELWGRILAGEIRKPGSYSLRTLEFVRNISKAEADLFECVGKFALQNGPVAMIPMNDKDWLERERKIYQSHRFLLAELGIMYPTDLTLRCFTDDREMPFFGDDHLLLVRRGKIVSPLQLLIWKFTEIGRQLLPLVLKPLDEAYYESFGSFFLERGGEVKIAKVTKREGNKVSYEAIKEIKRP
jgi:hypothetical protein